MNFFILYVALPALFFRILSKTPFEQLVQIDFIMATTLATYSAFTLAFIIGLFLQRGRIGEARRVSLWTAAAKSPGWLYDHSMPLNASGRSATRSPGLGCELPERGRADDQIDRQTISVLIRRYFGTTPHATRPLPPPFSGISV